MDNQFDDLYTEDDQHETPETVEAQPPQSKEAQRYQADYDRYVQRQQELNPNASAAEIHELFLKDPQGLLKQQQMNILDQVENQLLEMEFKTKNPELVDRIHYIRADLMQAQEEARDQGKVLNKRQLIEAGLKRYLENHPGSNLSEADTKEIKNLAMSITPNSKTPPPKAEPDYFSMPKDDFEKLVAQVKRNV